MYEISTIIYGHTQNDKNVVLNNHNQYVVAPSWWLYDIGGVIHTRNCIPRPWSPSVVFFDNFEIRHGSSMTPNIHKKIPSIYITCESWVDLEPLCASSKNQSLLSYHLIW